MRRAVRVWDADRGELLWTYDGHADLVADLVFGPGGDWLASSADDGALHVLDIRGQTATILGSAGFTMRAGPLGLLPTSRNLIVGYDDGTVRVWESATWREVAMFTAHTDRVAALAVSDDESRLVTTSATGNRRLWDLSSQEMLAERDGAGVAKLAFAPGGDRVFAGRSGGIEVLSADNLELVLTLRPPVESEFMWLFGVVGRRVTAWQPGSLVFFEAR